MMRSIIDLSDIALKEYTSVESHTDCHKQQKPSTRNNKINSTNIELDDNLQLLTQHYPGKILFTLDETAKIINVSYEFIRYRVAQETIPASPFGDRRMINIKTIAELLTKGVK